MVESIGFFRPRPLSKGQALNSNLFISWSPKSGRWVRLIGPSQFDAWLVLEWDSDVIEFCERPPISLQLLPRDSGKRAVDFWTRRRSGEQRGVLLHDPELVRDKACPLETLEASIKASRLHCEIWRPADIRSRSVLIRNLKQLQPFIATEDSANDKLATRLLVSLRKVKTTTWADLRKSCPSEYVTSVDSEIARLIHAGSIAANIADHSLGSNTMLSLP